ncbi:adenylate/guanylate cyclase domain-containing protein [Bradyrhizobium sp.]|uniref:adenylate/guanylate cyclase domain-containing protein n=1 Tax=Bradyrhizobium sp. TaxID=376 RepID=UPI002BE8ACF1|nr:adenylate/guanylate cyclase domain-containing protein [Bradyrhizobium sp.]HMM89713.1 adenylate/guanylate cyclase domain-containing protein [Bradyrhizobium sp.]
MATERIERRLTAILAADVAGYSRLTGMDEEGTHAQLQDHLRSLVAPKIAEHRGRVVKNTGDGLLAEFGSVVEAVRCAVEIQQDMVQRNADVPQEKRIEFRIGVNVGDIISDHADIFGDGVNVAARLEGLAEPGGICVSARVQEDVRGKLGVGFEDAGEKQLKNIDRPVRVYKVRAPGRGEVHHSRWLAPQSTRVWLGIGAVLAVLVGLTGWYLPRIVGLEQFTISRINPFAPAKTATDQPSVAVLPFANMTGDTSLDYFSDGLTEDLTAQLARNPELYVIARTSSFAYKGKSPDIRQVGQELGASPSYSSADC